MLRPRETSSSRAVQRELQCVVGEYEVEVEGSGPEGLGDVGDVVVPQDIESEASCAGHDTWVDADAAAILEVRDVPDVVVPVFDTPVSADDMAAGFGGEAFQG